MEKDFIKGLEFIGLTARINRLSDTLNYSARAHYRDLKLGIEPNWHLVFLLLKKHEKLTITSIANKLHLSHPAVIKIVKKMKEAGFLKSSTDKKDGRKNYIQLSTKAREKLPHLEIEWDKIQLVIKELANKDFMKNLSEFEHKLNEKSFKERYQDLEIKKEEFNIRNAKASEFEALGKIMVKVYSQLEGFPNESEQPEYYKMLANIGKLTEKEHTELIVAVSPEGKIVGGVVFFSDMKSYGSGGTATKIKNASGFRLLAVDDSFRGKGLGKLLSKECINKAKGLKHKKLIIHSTESMKIAWGMYERLGLLRFHEIDFSQGELPVFGFKLAL